MTKIRILYIYNTFVMLSHSVSVIPNVFANCRSYDENRKLSLWIGKNLEEKKFRVGMANISKILYFILSYEVIIFCKAYSINFFYALMQQVQYLIRYKLFIAPVCNSMLYMIFQLGWEPVLIRRIVKGFEAILKKLL